jgi:hypothetical protein
LQQGVAAATDSIVRREAVKAFGSDVPELDRAVEVPREHRLIRQHEQIGEAFCGRALHLFYFAT